MHISENGSVHASQQGCAHGSVRADGQVLHIPRCTASRACSRSSLDIVSDKDTKNLASRPWHTRGRGDASADDSLNGEVGSQSLNTVDEEDADARHLLGPLLDDLSDGGPSTNRRG